MNITTKAKGWWLVCIVSVGALGFFAQAGWEVGSRGRYHPDADHPIAVKRKAAKTLYLSEKDSETYHFNLVMMLASCISAFASSYLARRNR